MDRFADLEGKEWGPGELAAFQLDLLLVGVAIAERVERPNGTVLVRLPPEYLTLGRDGSWRYVEEPFTPGDGRWVFGVDRLGPISLPETHSAPPAAEPITVEAIVRACEALRSAVDEPATPGFEVSILESTGQGYQAFAEAMKQADDDLMFALVGPSAAPGRSMSPFGTSLFSSIALAFIAKDRAVLIRQDAADRLYGPLGPILLPEPPSRSDEFSWNTPLPRPAYSANFPVILHHDSSSFPRRPLKRRRLGSAAHRRFLRRQARQQ